MPKPDDLKLDHIAHLARINLTEAEKARFATQLGDVLAYIAQLNEVRTYPGSSRPRTRSRSLNVLGTADVAQPGLSVEDALRNAPEMRDNMFVVPKVVE